MTAWRPKFVRVVVLAVTAMALMPISPVRAATFTFTIYLNNTYASGFGPVNSPYPQGRFRPQFTPTQLSPNGGTSRARFSEEPPGILGRPTRPPETASTACQRRPRTGRAVRPISMHPEQGDTDDR